MANPGIRPRVIYLQAALSPREMKSLFHGSDITPRQIRTAVKDGTFGELLSYSQSKEEAIAGGSPAAVIARDQDGGEVKVALVDSTNPQVVAEQNRSASSR